jgi:acyl-[acyl-carrier-protein]-phospholipid O-acyltransferase/long-chain-fatty-acid--[acyl-carrier-protein] ligase
VSVNLPRREGLAGAEESARPGSVGRPLPGVAVRIVDVASGEPLPPGEEGRVRVYGASVMRGYLDEPERTAEVLRDGWYDTGDLGRIDRDGFLVLTDRASRFAKIGGEMVPLGRVEEELSELAARLSRDAGAPDEVELAVCALPDERKGERLVVLHTPLPFAVDAWLEALRASELPRLFHPRAEQFFEVDAIPQLGSGKTDLAAVRALAERRCAEASGRPRGEE